MSTQRVEFVARAAFVVALGSLGVFVAVRAAVARGGRVGNARSFVTVAGTLTNVTGATRVTFELRRRGETAALCAPEVMVTPGAGGAFSAEVPVGAPEVACPDDLFDGRDVEVRALVGGAMAADWAAVNPVPYAHFATSAGSAAQATGPLLARIAALEAQASMDCPPGYTRDATPPFDDVGGNLRRLCRKPLPDGSVDEVVRVGTPPSVFWVDRFEASVIGASAPYAHAFESEPAPSTLPRNGVWALESRTTSSPLTSPLLARSVHGVTPARWVTWFQAMELCRMAGKRLPTGEEWLTAAMGTDDPGDNNGSSNDRCNTRSLMSGPRVSGNGAGCRSHWGAQDMVGNVRELTAEWHAGLHTATTGDPTSVWGDYGGVPYGGDGTWSLTSAAYPGGAGRVVGIPSAVFRGGAWGDGTRAGVYSLGLDGSPSSWDYSLGFRCVMRR